MDVKVRPYFSQVNQHKMGMNVTGLIFFCTFVVTATAFFDPKLNLDDCSEGKIVLTLTNAEPNGIMFVQGRGEACIQNITTRDNTYEFRFDICGINWDETFSLVVQKKSAYLTHEDKRFPLTCSVNLGEQTIVKNVRLQDLEQSRAQTKSVRPQAAMKLLKGTQDISGQTVTLSDTLTMELALSGQYSAGFDIKALTCHASNLQTINNGCSMDLDLFPHMTRVKQGQLTAQFRAFRPTDLTGGLVQMPFRCLIEVCLGSCQASVCRDGMRSFGRRSTAINHPLMTDDGLKLDVDENFNVTVGSSIIISDPPDTYSAQQYENKVCMEKHSVGLLLSFLLLGLLSAAICCVFLFRSLRHKSNLLKRFHSDYLCVPSL